MEEASISDSPSALNRRITDLTSSGNGTAANCDEPSLAVEISLPLSPMENEIIADSQTLCAFISEDMQDSLHLASIGAPNEESFCSDAQEIQKPLPSSGETAGIVAENLSPADSETILAVLGEVTQEIEANGKPKDESSGFGKLSDEIDTGGGGFGEVSQEIEAGDAAIGKPKEESSGGLAVGGRFGCSLEFEFIDDTAVIGLSKIGGDLLDTAGRKNGKMESEAKKDKKPRRRSKAAKKVSGETKSCSSLKVSIGNSTGYKRTEKGTKKVYSVKEMEALRYRNVKGQKKMWQEVYNTLSPTARTEYDELGGFRHQNNQSGLTWDTSRAPGVLGMAAARGGQYGLDYYGRGGNCRGFYGEGGNYVNFYRGGGSLNFFGCGRFTS